MIKKKELLYKIEHLENYVRNIDRDLEKIEEQTNKHETTIKHILDAVEPILIKNCKDNLDNLFNDLERAIEEVFFKKPKKEKKTKKSCQCITEIKRGRGRPRKENK